MQFCCSQTEVLFPESAGALLHNKELAEIFLVFFSERPKDDSRWYYDSFRYSRMTDWLFLTVPVTNTNKQIPDDLGARKPSLHSSFIHCKWAICRISVFTLCLSADSNVITPIKRQLPVIITPRILFQKVLGIFTCYSVSTSNNHSNYHRRNGGGGAAGLDSGPGGH